jgi:hypothetical protein
MASFFKSLGIAVIGYVLGALAGCGAITLLSDNRHDRSVEAAMTGAFATGPLLAVIGFVSALVIFSKRSRSRADAAKLTRGG